MAQLFEYSFPLQKAKAGPNNILDETVAAYGVASPLHLLFLEKVGKLELLPIAFSGSSGVLMKFYVFPECSLIFYIMTKKIRHVKSLCLLSSRPSPIPIHISSSNQEWRPRFEINQFDI